MVSGCSVEDPRGILGCDFPFFRLFSVDEQDSRSPAIHQQDEQSKILGGSSHLGSVGYIPLFFVRYFLVRRVNPIVGLQHPRNVSCTIHLDQQLSDSVPTFGIQFQHGRLAAENQWSQLEKHEIWLISQ